MKHQQATFFWKIRALPKNNRLSKMDRIYSRCRFRYRSSKRSFSNYANLLIPNLVIKTYTKGFRQKKKAANLAALQLNLWHAHPDSNGGPTDSKD